MMHKIRTCQSVGRIEDRPPKIHRIHLLQSLIIIKCYCTGVVTAYELYIEFIFHTMKLNLTVGKNLKLLVMETEHLKCIVCQEYCYNYLSEIDEM